MSISKVAAIAFAGIAALVPATVSFAGYSVGSIQGQDGWSGGSTGYTQPIYPTVHQGITNAPGAAHTGSQSWLMSNSEVDGFTQFGILGKLPFAPSLSVAAGQPSSGEAADTFQASFYFKSVSTSATGDGSYVQIDFGDSLGSDRTNFFAIKNIGDANGGMQLRSAETINGYYNNSVDDPQDQFIPTQTISSNIDRSVWHHLVVTGHFLNGDGNDYYTVDLDGASVLNLNNTSLSNGVVTGSPNYNSPNFFTFEGFWNYPPEDPLPYELTSRLYFDIGAPPSAYGDYSDTADGLGYYFDDMTYKVFNSSDPNTILDSFDSNSFEPALTPEPSTFAALLVGAMGLIARRRRSSIA